MAEKGKVYVGLSGGVDSAVSAALLKSAGYNVTGCFIRGWHPDYLTCTWKEDRRDAMRVAAHLDIPFVEFDASDAYKKLVVDEMTAAYDRGDTPNPDILCNEKIKFGVFYDFAVRSGADFVATGHYAQSKNGKLLMSADLEKDQTYFLWAVPGERIAKTIFPVGEYTKAKVRKFAKKFGMPVSEKKDSQGVCFLGQLDLAEFMEKHIQLKEGNVEDSEGSVIGTHKGVQAYTLGQRHGFHIEHDHPDAVAYHVIEKDAARNVLIVGPQSKTDSISTLTLKQTNWMGEAPKVGDKVSVRIRHRGNLEPMVVEKVDANSIILKAIEPIEPVSVGQSAVFYVKNQCLGGGVVSC